MSAEKSKKYFWLRLKDDFFTSKEIKKLRKIAGGDTYTIIYLKMQLLSIKNEGILMYEGTEANLVEQLSLELDEDSDNIKITLAFLQANKLIEQLSEDEYLLNRVPECIGSETNAAERMRKMREKRNNVTPLLQPVTKCYTEIEIDIEKEIDIEESQQSSDEISEPNDPDLEFQESSVEIQLSRFMIDEILKVKPDSKVPNKEAKGLQKWAQHIDYLIRIDKRDPRTIAELFRWTQEDTFWCANIRSPKKLREKWDTLEIQRSRNNKNNVPKKIDRTTKFHTRESRSEGYSAEDLNRRVDDIAVKKRQAMRDKSNSRQEGE